MAEHGGGRAWRALEGSAGLLIVAMTALVALQVFARYVVNYTLPWSEELSRYVFLWASFLGACVALGRRAHLGVDSLVTRLPAAARTFLERVVVVAVGAFAFLLGYQGLALLPALLTQRSPTMGLPVVFIFAAVPRRRSSWSGSRPGPSSVSGGRPAPGSPSAS